MFAIGVRRRLESALWVSAALFFGVYFAGRAFGELERRLALDSFSAMRMSASVKPLPSQSAVHVIHPDTSPAAPGVDHVKPAAGASGVPAADIDTHAVPDPREWSPARIREYAAIPGVIADVGSAPVGVLRIGRVGLTVPVYADIAERNLNRGAGLVAGTAALGSAGNIGIAAHRDGYFRALRNVVIGDVIELESVNGLRAYRITGIWIVDPTEVSVLDPTPEPAVTLVTCYPFFFVGSAPKRYIVRALAEQ